MRSSFIDTNLFIRYLTNDDPAKAERVAHLLREAAAGKARLVTAEMVIAEVVWVLESSYELKSAEVAPLVRAILATSGLDVLNAPLVARALEHYESRNVDFIDGYIAAAMEKLEITDIYSFDRKHISRIHGLARKEP
jgi:predicted nucleic-acid-binding protein